MMAPGCWDRHGGGHFGEVPRPLSPNSGCEDYIYIYILYISERGCRVAYLGPWVRWVWGWAGEICLSVCVSVCMCVLSAGGSLAADPPFAWERRKGEPSDPPAATHPSDPPRRPTLVTQPSDSPQRPTPATHPRSYRHLAGVRYIYVNICEYM